MKRFFCGLLLPFSFLFSCEQSIDAYLEYFSNYPQIFGPKGSYQKGEIEIVLDKARMLAIEKNIKREVGLILEDQYWIWINDAVIFPSGKEGVYGRILWKSSLTGSAGVAVLPLLADQKIALNVNYRHATRSFELELPRGIREKYETNEDAAKRELEEETGYLAKSLHYLGDMQPDSGLTNTRTPIYLGFIDKLSEAKPEDSEAIDSIAIFTLDEIDAGIKKGYIELQIKNELQKVYIRDSHVLFAIYLAKIKGLLF